MAGMYDPRLVVPEELASRWQVILRYAVAMPSIATVLLLTSLWGGFGASLGGWLAGLAALLVGGLTMLWSRGWWSRVDEAVREAHKTAWYWGGSVGMVPVMGLAAALVFDKSGVSLDRFAAVPGDGGLILTGIVVTLLLQLIGYGLFWAGWWFTRSR